MQQFMCACVCERERERERAREREREREREQSEIYEIETLTIYIFVNQLLIANMLANIRLVGFNGISAIDGYLMPNPVKNNVVSY